MILENAKYSYSYPITYLGKNVKSDNPTNILQRLKKRNPYYCIFNQYQRKCLLDRILSLFYVKKWLMKEIESYVPSNEVLSVYSYGSYLYRNFKYIPNDIDIGIIIKGSYFKYVIDNITIPQSIMNKLDYPVSKISLFFYGDNNISNGTQINDTIITELIHSETIKREASIAYLRNIVIWGKDFLEIPNNIQNTFITIGRMLNGCKERLERHTDYDYENRLISLVKISTRLVEANIFINFFYPNKAIDIHKLLKLPHETSQKKYRFIEIESIYKNTLRLFEETITNYSIDKSLKFSSTSKG